MPHPHAELAAHVRAFLLRAGDHADPKTVDAFLASEAFAEIVIQYNESLLREFVIFAAAQIPDAHSPSEGPPKVSLFEFEDLSNVSHPPAPHYPPAASEAPAAAPAAAASVEPAPVASTAPAPATARPLHPDVDFRLPNARAGEAYQQTLIPSSADNDDLVLLEVKFPSALDFRADLPAFSVSGTAAIADEYKIEVVYSFRSEGLSCRRKAVVPLLVNPDPKSLWKNLPSDRSAPFWKEDAVCSAVTGPELHMVAASKRGRSHAHVGGFRDDDYFLHHSHESGWYTAIVADGAGSARFSREGARLVCEESGKYLVDALTGQVGDGIEQAAAAYHAARTGNAGEGAVEAARQALRNALYMAVGHAAFHGVKAISEAVAAHAGLQAAYKDFSTTALIAITRRFAFGTLCAAYWVGDGAIAIYSKDRGVTLLGAVDSGEFSGQTRFLDADQVSAEALLRRTRFELVDDMTALILMSDGVSDPKFETESRLERASAWDALWTDLEQAVNPADRSGAEQRLLAWLDFWSQGNHDDRTIAIVSPE